MARGMEAALICTFALLFCGLVRAQVSFNEITGFSLSPPYFNLAEGARISATATCGQDEGGRPRSDLYCKLVGGPTTGPSSQTIQGQFCDHCNSNDPDKAHPVTHAIDGTERWWQSPPLSRGPRYGQVNITLDLGQLFHVAYVLIKFANTPRPDLWVLERSVDHGRTYVPWQYFAHSKRECIERFGKQPNSRIVRDDDQICTTEYSRIVPLENGEIVVSLVNGRPGARNFTYSPVLRDFTKATNIRLSFLRTSTLLGHLISKAQRDPTVTRRYYYSIKDISVGGRCVCHGHAQVCGGRNAVTPDRLQCECRHNTCGESCDRCCPGFHQKPWRAATASSPNECQPCQCHSHASDCRYDPAVEQRRASLNTFGIYDGGGVCLSCQHNTAGVNCERCVEGYYRPYGVPPESPSGCIPCRCDPRTSAGCEMGSGRCLCRPEFTGSNCDRCSDGFYGYSQCIRYPPVTPSPTSPPTQEPAVCPRGYFGPPSCQQCVCHSGGTVPEVCDASGRCLCRGGVQGGRCDRCRPGHHSFPHCQVCRCDGAGVIGRDCGPDGQCRCLDNYAGQRCDQCAPGYYGYPDCGLCQCSREGSYDSMCNPVSGQCLCRPGVLGQQCDRCAASGLRFPHCSAPVSQCSPVGAKGGSTDPHTGSCVCLPYVEGPLCDRCKPLYWKLAAENPSGCIECTCDVKGTLSGVGECHQKSGHCHCKPNTCSATCDTCKDGYFLLQKKNYFGCQGCQCDVGGATGKACDGVSGQCRCRKNVIGRTCTEPAAGHFFPSMHQLKYEAEDGITPNARPVRFGYDPRAFPGFSWRGYAVMSPAQPEVILSLAVAFAGPFHIVVRYATPHQRRARRVRARILVVDEAGFHSCCDWASQSREAVFPPSDAPAFLSVPGDGFAEPFPLTPGKWVIRIRAEGILLDYLVLLPSDFYDAPLLQEKITQPCAYTSAAEPDTNCLLYKHVAMDGFSSALGAQGRLSTRGGGGRRRRGRGRRQGRVLRPTQDHPEMMSLSGRQTQLQLSLRVAEPGPYVLVLEYASDVDHAQNANLLITGQSEGQIQARANVYSCSYSFLCRSVAVDSASRTAVFHLTHKAELLIQTSTAAFLLYKVYMVPVEDFSMAYVEPKVLCVSVHGRFTQDSQYCVPARYPIPDAALLLDAARDGSPSSSSLPLAPQPRERESEEWRRRRQSGAVPPLATPPSEGVLLKSPQTEISFSGRVAVPGLYVVLVHFRQPEHAAVPVAVRVNAGHAWTGSVNASFCPRVSGCREAVVSGRRVALDLPQEQLTVSLRVPPGKTLTLDYILVVPDHIYTPDLLKEMPLDKSADFTRLCGAEGFHVDPRTSSKFCRDSALSLVAAYNDGALPCNCDKSGSTAAVCDPIGGQCPCRPHVIGRQCTKCATGYYGFPYCRPCECGARLCDEVTGQCVCPPQTVRPACDVCESQTFSFHPLLGCEGCNCSPNGTPPHAGPDCHQDTGQCTCKPRIGGRQCDRCAAGFYRFPDCLPCDCSRGGVSPDVCHPDTGRCLCKKNVQGVRCDACRDGAFHLDPAHPHGCTSCFCFGATDQCQSSSKRRGKFVDMGGWRLERSDLEEVPSVLNPASNTLVADVQELPASARALHWVAPPSYLGDRVSSYGGYLTYQAKSFGIPSEGMTLTDRSPDVLITGQDMTLVHRAAQPPAPDRLHQGRVQLVEGNWRHAATNRPVSREELVTALAALEGLRVRALYFTQSQRLSLGEVGLEEALPTGAGGPAHSVEDCACPPRYTGDSCQTCAPGHHRDGSGPYLGRCVPCNCNGRADECDPRTGRCLNCRFDSAGDKCERCRDGYYGDPARRSCRPCPCPSGDPSNSFALGCREVGGRFQCVCRPGYSGERCERCAPGYYGDPVTAGGSCRICNCNGVNCDSKTGVCKNTMEPNTSPDEQCRECDSCAQTLISDLERLDDELSRIKAQLDNATASATAQDRLAKLEKAIADTRALVDKFNKSVSSQKPKVAQLEQDTLGVNDDITVLKNKADKKAGDAKKALEEVEKTHNRAKHLDREAKDLLRRIQALLDQLKEAGASGDAVPGEELSRMLEEARRLVREMEGRSFNPQKGAAKKERDEAQKLLDYIQANVSRQCEVNQEAAQRVRGLLEAHQAKLRDLEDALREARELVKKADAQNRLNAQEMKDVLKRMEELKKEREKVQDQINMAKDQLQDTDDLLKMLEDSKMEYEQLAAKLDGAKTDLTKRVNAVSQAAAKEGLVERAERHAENLNKLAKELEDAVRNSSDRADVQNAMAAIDAYRNITDAVNAAEKAANGAKDAADKALKDVKKEDLTKRAKDLKTNGKKLLTDAEDAERDLKVASDDLAAQKKRLRDAEKKKKALEKDLAEAQAELKNIKRDDIGDMIDEAKRKAAAANGTAGTTMDRLNAIREEVDKINVLPPDTNLTSMMDEVDQSVKKLLKSIPSLEEKMAEVEDLSSQLSPASNISENIKRIKELIEQARDAANRVVVPMKFSGEGHVELRPPRDAEDLRAYTALTLSLQRPEVAGGGRGDGVRRRRQNKEEDMFVLYLGNRDASGDYVGMALRKNVLFCMYKLNGVEQEMKTDTISRSASEPAMFDRVVLHRIYQDAEVILTKLFTSNDPDPPRISTNQGELAQNLLNLDPSDVVFYVGGYPANFTPPASLNYPSYKGCLELSTFNDRFISLYNFKKAVKVNLETPCKRYMKPKVSHYFEGTGYAKVAIEKVRNVLLLEQTINTRSENGLLLYIGNKDAYYSVTMERGFLVLRSNLLREPARSTNKVFPPQEPGDQVEVLIIIESSSSKEFKIRVSKKDVIKAGVQYKPGDFKEYYIGGLPQALRDRDNVTAQPLKACVTGVKFDRSFVTFQESVGISKGCPKDFLASRKAEFSLGSSLTLSSVSAPVEGFSLLNNATVSLGFKSTENQGVLMQFSQNGIGMELALDNGHVVLKSKDKLWKSNKQYHDGKWHYLTATKRDERMELRVDEQDEGRQQRSASLRVAADNAVLLGKDTFKGCLTNLYMRRPDKLFKAEDLSRFSSSGNVLLDVCSSDRPPQLMLDRHTSQRGGAEVAEGNLSVCALPALVKQAFHVGGSATSLTYDLSPQALQPRPHFSLEVRTRSAEGLLFYAATRGSPHLALYVSKGRIRLSVGKAKEIFNREKYNDGKWHSVIFSLERKRYRLVVDGIRAQDGQLTSDEAASMELLSPVHLGSAPEPLHRTLKSKLLPKHSVVGCIRSFKMNGAPVPGPTTNHGAGPCFDGQTQGGAYFSGEGAYVVISDSFVVGSSFELVFEFRPRALSGVLLHAGDSRPRRGPGPAPGHAPGPHLSLYMHRGEVVVQVNDGAGEFRVSVRPKHSLCDGMFHRVAVIKKANVVEMHVDTEGDYKIGPPSSSPALTKEPLYVGGVPVAFGHQNLPVDSSFVGCLQNMRINQDLVSFDKLPGAFGPVNLRECPAG